MPSHALVTGASSGLGRELVRQLVLERGMTVLATARRQDRLESLARELPPGRVVVLAGDLADPDFRDRLWECAEGLPGGIDLLVNNAGLGNYHEFADQDPEMVRQILAVNLEALLDLTAKGIRAMKARGTGQILQISSILGFMGLPYSAVYVATKHAVNGLVKSLRYELRGTGVRVWAACPGQTESEFFQAALGERSNVGGGSPGGLQPRGSCGRSSASLTVGRASCSLRFRPARRPPSRTGSPDPSTGSWPGGRPDSSAPRSNGRGRRPP